MLGRGGNRQESQGALSLLQAGFPQGRDSAVQTLTGGDSADCVNMTPKIQTTESKQTKGVRSKNKL